jgi:hypothetical protein
MIKFGKELPLLGLLMTKCPFPFDLKTFIHRMNGCQKTNHEGKYQLEVLGGEWIILRFTLNKWDWRVWTVFI